MANRRDLIGKPEEENTASSSTQSASGLGGGTPEGGPTQLHERARRVTDDSDTAGEDGIENPALPDEDDDVPAKT